MVFVFIYGDLLQLYDFSESYNREIVLLFGIFFYSKLSFGSPFFSVLFV